MRIGYVVPRYLPCMGGVQTHVAQIARRVAANGHEVEVLTEERDPDLPSLGTIDGVQVRRFPVLQRTRRYTIAPGLWTYLGRHSSRYAVLHAHSYHELPALAAALTTRRPLVFTPHYHGTGRTRLGRLLHPPYRAVGSWIFFRSTRVICVSEAEASLVRRHFPFAAKRISVIPNGLDIAALHSAEPFQTDRTVILTCGRLIESKNVHLAIEALAHLDDGFLLYVVGDGPARPELEEHTHRLQLHDRVRFLGHVDNETLYRWLRTATVYVSMSRQEAFGITLAEALAAGAAVVASDIPTHLEVVAAAGAEQATLVPLDLSPGALAQTIRDMAAHERTESAQTSLMSWDTVAARTMAVYDEVFAE